MFAPFLILFNREVIGCAVGEHKDAELVKRAMRPFHTTTLRFSISKPSEGDDFDNKTVDAFLEPFGIIRSSVKKELRMTMR